MSELIRLNSIGMSYRLKLLAGTSAGVLLVNVASAAQAAPDDNKPAVWIELGGQLERLDGAPDMFLPGFATTTPVPVTYQEAPTIPAQRFPRYDLGFEGAATIQPKGSEWMVLASIRYGRSSGAKHVHAEAPFNPTPTYAEALIEKAVETADTSSHNRESHFIFDFDVGRDVGIGLFGPRSNSEISFGVRIAQFSQKSDVALRARPYQTASGSGLKYHYYVRSYAASRSIDSRVNAIGPSIAWKSDARLVGGDDDSLNFDGGINASVLFGRQKADVERSMAGYFRSFGPLPNGHNAGTLYPKHTFPRSRSRSVAIPNIGGFAALSWSLPDAKVSFGYRADLFLNAIDGGVDTAHSKNVSFHGPYATVSIGIGG